MKTRILDTNVILDRPLDETISIIEKKDKECLIIIPLSVLIELDTFKGGNEPKNVYCRLAINLIEKLRAIGKKTGEKLHQGVVYKKGITMKIAVDQDELDAAKVDNRIILLAQKIVKDSKDEVLLITEDVHERVVADVFEVEAQSLHASEVDVSKLHTGKVEIDITDKQVEEFSAKWSGNKVSNIEGLVSNQFCIMKDSFGQKHYGIYNSHEKCIMGLQPNYEAWGIKPKKSKKTNDVIKEQSMLMHLLLDPNIKLVTAVGPSGCGKTLLTLACALKQTVESDTYNKIIVMRPLVSIGKDLGALPGDKLEKIEPWMASTFDNLEFLLQGYTPKDMSGMYVNIKDKIDDLVHTGRLELEAITYIRGRSIPRQFIIIDDAQNLTPDQAVSIITRAGEGTKVVFLGDISKQQIDDHRLSPSSNGLAFIVDKSKGKSSIVGHITMEETVRSDLAQLGVEIGNET